MKSAVVSGRVSYSSGGGVNWLRFLPLAGLTLAASGVLALLMHLLFRWGHYYLVIVPVVAALGVTGMGILAVVKGHCRSSIVAAGLGLVAGTLMYLGYYHVGMIDDLGMGVAPELKLLPEYIRWRKQVEVTEDTHGPRREDGESKPRMPSTGRTVMNWLVFGGELVGVLALTIAGPLRRSRKAYCEICHRWTRRGVTRLEVDKGPVLVEALENDSAQTLASCFAAPEYPSVPNTTVAVDYCPRLGEAPGQNCAAYLSIKVIATNPQGAALDEFDSAKGTLLARQVRLNERELLAVLPRFPMFEGLTGQTAESALKKLAVGPEVRPAPATVVAQIRPVPAGMAGRVLTRRTAVISTLIAFGGLLLLFAGLGLMAWGGTMAFPDRGAPTPPTNREKVGGITLLALGGIAFAGVAISLFVDPSWMANRYLMGVLKREFLERGSHLVDPGDPAAMLVEIVPKLNWGKLKLESASDVGYLKIDEGRREILFEGDKELWRIPIDAVTSCEVEVFVEGQGTHGATKLFYTVLQAAHPSGFWEAPIRRRGSTGMFASKKRRQSAEECRRKILALRSGGAVGNVG